MLEQYGNHLLMSDWYNNYHGIMKENVDFEGSHLYNRKSGQFLSGLTQAALAPLSIRITKEMVEDAKEKLEARNADFPYDMFMRIVNEFDGYVPLKLQSLPEGTWCPAGTPFAQIRNTVEGFGELNTWWEPLFMMASFDSGCITRAYYMHKYLKYISERFSIPWDVIKTKYHSFGFRGHRSIPDAIKAAKGWSTWMYGTDDMHVLNHAPNADIGSIPAAGHKVTQQFDDELKGVLYGIQKTSDMGKNIVAYPIDTYDPHRFIHEHMRIILNKAEELKMHFVARPDSANVLEQAIDIYNTHQRGKNRTNLSVIIGESMTFENAKEYDLILLDKGVPIEFVSYGIGSGFYNDLNRDTHGWAMKTCFSNHAPRMKFSADSLKRSIPGFIDLVRTNGELTVVPEGTSEGLYQTIYEYDPAKGHTAPVFTPYESQNQFENTQKEAHFQDEQGYISQERIILSREILADIEKFRVRYQ